MNAIFATKMELFALAANRGFGPKEQAFQASSPKTYKTRSATIGFFLAPISPWLLGFGAKRSLIPYGAPSAKKEFRVMRLAGPVASVAMLLASAATHAQQIAADRPGVGSAPEVVPPFTLQAELGTDSREVRLGLFRGFEIDRDDSSWAGKLALIDNAKLKASFKLSYDNDLHTVLEIPANYTFNAGFNLGTTVVWSRTMQTYAGEFNFTPTTRLTITPTLYYESKTRAAIFVAWVLPHHDNWQIDAGYDQHRFSAGISTALDLSHWLKKVR